MLGDLYKSFELCKLLYKLMRSQGERLRFVHARENMQAMSIDKPAVPVLFHQAMHGHGQVNIVKLHWSPLGANLSKEMSILL